MTVASLFVSERRRGRRLWTTGTVLSGGVFLAIALTANAIATCATVAWLAVLAVLVVAPMRKTVPPTFCALALVYFQAAMSGEYVGEVPLATRVCRDALLLAMLLAWTPRVRAMYRNPVVATLSATAGLTAVLLLRSGDGTTDSLVRYFLLTPLLAFTVAKGLALENVDPTHFLSRLIAAIAVSSAIFGLGQATGVLPSKFYTGYTVFGIPRAVGIVGQPNNQAFLLVLGLACMRAIPLRRGLAVTAKAILVAGVGLTFSRGGVLLLAVVLVLTATPRPASRRILKAIFVGAAVFCTLPWLTAVRRTAFRTDGRITLAKSAFGAVSRSALLLGAPSVRNGRTTDNLWIDLLLIGGVGLVALWGLLFWRLWASGRGRYLTRVAIMMFTLGGSFTSSFQLFPTVLYAWSVAAVPFVIPSVLKPGCDDSAEQIS